jgi:hypothetical protein
MIARVNRKMRAAERELLLLSIRSLIRQRTPSASWLQRQRTIELIRKLRRLAGNNQNRHEARLAAERAAGLMERYGFSEAEI